MVRPVYFWHEWIHFPATLAGLSVSLCIPCVASFRMCLHDMSHTKCKAEQNGWAFLRVMDGEA